MANIGQGLVFLDDLPERRAHARQLWPACTLVSTVAECIEVLKLREWVTVCLDHDLNGTAYEDSAREDCGAEVARWICKNSPAISEIILHSHNPHGTEVMFRMLSDFGYTVYRYPFGKGVIWNQKR